MGSALFALGDGHGQDMLHDDIARVGGVPTPPDPAADMLGRAIKLLTETKGDSWVNKGSIWHMIKRLDPTFDPKDHGHANFPAMVKALDLLIEVKKGDSDQLVRLR